MNANTLLPSIKTHARTIGVALLAGMLRIFVAAAISTPASIAYGQTLTSYPAPAPHLPALTDAMSVDVLSRTATFKISDVTIGSGTRSLEHYLSSETSRFDPNRINDPFHAGIVQRVDCATVGSLAESDCFAGNTTLRHTGATLEDMGSNRWRYTTRNGTIYEIDATKSLLNAYAAQGAATKATKPDGTVVEFYYDSVTFYNPNVGQNQTAWRLQSVYSSDGFGLKYEYASDAFDISQTGPLGIDWRRLSKVTAFNRALESCPIQARHCNFANPWRSAQYNWTVSGQELVFNIIDASGVASTFRLGPTKRVLGYRPSSSQIERYQYTYCRDLYFNEGDPCEVMQFSGNGLSGSGNAVQDGVKWVVADGQQWNYKPYYSVGGCGCIYANSSTDPKGNVVASVAAQNTPGGSIMLSATGIDANWSSFDHDYVNRLQTFSSSSGTQNYTYDDRGNLLQKVRSATGMSSVTETAVYPTTCASNITCNKPTSTTDARGKTYDYTYDPVHGGVLTETGPADQYGVRPEKRFSYVQRYAYFYNDAGALAPAATPIWLVDHESYCRTSSWTGSACSAGASDEVVTTYEYGPTSGPNNLLLRGVAVTADGATRRTCYGYNRFGEKISETTAMAGLAVCP